MIDENCDNCYSSYDEYTSHMVMNKHTEKDPMMKKEMLFEIQSIDFAITDLALYLDTHPEDEKALSLYKRYCRESNELRTAYQKVYGPLTMNFPCNKWRWIEEPWPWEGGNV